MALTDFGKAIRKARIDAGENLGTMADELGLSPAFLSGMETGRKKIPANCVDKIQKFFASRQVSITDLGPLAAVANQSVSLEGLSPEHQMLIAGFARSSLDGETLQRMAELLSANKKD